MKPLHINAKKNEIASTVIMPGDPLRAKYIAEKYLKDAKLVSDIRNMYAYTGYYKDKLVTVMGSGMGIPSIGIYSYELYTYYNVDKIIRIGTAGSLDKKIKELDLVLASDAYSPSSFAYVWGKNIKNIIKSDSDINNDILLAAKNMKKKVNYGTILTADVFTLYANIDHILKKVPSHIHLLCNEMEAFGLFHIANICGKKAACIVTIVDSPYEKSIISNRIKEKKLNDMITIALESI